MKQQPLSYWASAIGAQLVGEDLSFSEISLDTRKLTNAAVCLFVALRGQRHDSHQFIATAHELGARCFLVEELPQDELKGASYLLVEDSLRAFQKMAAHHRSNWKNPVWGITGSNGKTTVKEWLAQALSSHLQVARSPKSFNSQVGVPMSLLLQNGKRDVNIIEAGISMPGEMAALESMIQPEIGIITLIGEAHLEHFQDKAALAREKCLLFQNCEQVLFPKDDPFIEAALDEMSYSGERLTWGKTKHADLQILQHSRHFDTQKLSLKWQGESFEVIIPFSDQASRDNAMMVSLCMLNLGFGLDIVRSELARLNPVSMRMEILEGKHHSTIISDVYSNDLASFEIALDELRWLRNESAERTVVLSDILGSSIPEKKLYRRVFELLKEKGVTRLIGVGPAIARNAPEGELLFEHYPNTESLLQEFDVRSIENAALLVKGARIYELEKFVTFLQEQHHETVLEINLDHLVQNLNHYRGKAGKNTKVMAMVKAFGYGTGASELASALEYEQVDYLGVAYPDEGVELRQQGIEIPIMVLNAPISSAALFVKYDLEPVIYSLKQGEGMFKAWELMNLSEAQSIHLELDTGMKRLGFEEDQLSHVLELLTEHQESVKVRSIYSHFVAADDPSEDDFTLEQIARFERMSALAKEKLAYPFLMHLSNTSGIERWPQARFDMVRLGIGLYGISNSASERNYLTPVATLKSMVSQVKQIKKGESIGYARSFIAEKDMEIATVAIGYADGLSRRLSNGKGALMINGVRVPILGRICMDMTMLDVSGLGVVQGDEALVFGENPRIEEIANLLETIPYEVISGVSKRVKRVYVHL